MSRPMTSNVAALSGFVANGHQAIHFVSPAPSKIPYGGFSPVRLQTHLTQRPPSPAHPRRPIGRHWRYLRPRRLIRNGTCIQSAPKTSDHDRGSSGPWLPNRLYCPAGSSLTMATSAPLPAARRLMNYSARLRDQPASRRGSPLYSANPFTPCRRPYSGGSSGCSRRFLHHWYCLRHIRTGSATTNPTIPEPVGRVTKLQRSLYATACQCRLPCSGQDVYDRACPGRVTPCSQVGYDWMVHCHLPSPDFHRLMWIENGLLRRPPPKPDRRFSRIRLSSSWPLMDWLRHSTQGFQKSRASRAGLRPAHLFCRRSTVRSASYPRPGFPVHPGAQPCGTTRTLVG